MPRPRVAHVINSIGLGGVPEAAYHLLRTLPKAYDCRLMVLRPLPVEAEPARIERLERFRSLGVPVSFLHPAPKPLGDLGSFARWLADERIDILHTHSYRPNLLARTAAALRRGSGLKVLAHYHNEYDANWQRDQTLELDRQLAGVTDCFVSCSAAVRRHVAERLDLQETNVTVVPNGVDTARFPAPLDREAARRRFELPLDAPIVGLIGRLSEQKGQDTLVRALALLRRSHPKAVVALAGAADSADQGPRLEVLARELGVGDAVRILGFVSDMPELYAALDAVAAPSRWEGFGLMLVEAMAAERPIVASRVGAIPEVVGEDGAAALVPPDDPVALADALARVLTDPGLVACMQVRGRERARRFTWERSGQRLGELYEEMLRGGNT